MNVNKCIKESFTVIGKEGSTLDGQGFVQRLWEDANSHFAEVQHLAKKDENGELVFEQKKDENGEPVTDENGNPVKGNVLFIGCTSDFDDYCGIARKDLRRLAAKLYKLKLKLEGR